MPKNLIDALIEVESNGDDNAEGDMHLQNHTFGCLQIRLPVCIDVNNKFNTSIEPQDMLGNRALSIDTFHKYISIYATAARLGREPTDQDCARIWNGGPNGYKSGATVHYWEKVEGAMA